MTPNEILDTIQHTYREILGPKLTGIYVHGSLALGCFRWDVSDIDFLVVVNAPLTQSEKESLITCLLELDPHAPPKGLEMSVVLETVCSPFRYPTPFELHFSNFHKARYQQDLSGYCRILNGTDKDLAAHVTVIRKVGLVLCGKPIDQVFAPVPKEAYINSLLYDIADAEADILDNPVYYILNLCRILAYLEEGIILSKAQGGDWGIKRHPRYADLVHSAREAYRLNTTLHASDAVLSAFARDLLKLIHQII